MRLRNVVRGQRVTPAKIELARRLRQNMTAEERLLWDRLRANRFHQFHFRRQQIIAGFVVDFYCHQAGLVIELDGAVHSKQAGYDLGRDRALSHAGLTVLRFTNDAVNRSIEQVLDAIARRLPVATSPPFPLREGGQGG